MTYRKTQTKYPTSGPVDCDAVKGMLVLNTPWWVDTGITGCTFVLPTYGADDSISLARCPHMDSGGRLSVPEGYLWDGSSRPIVRSQEDYDLAPSLFHDVFEEAWRAGKLRREHMSIGDRVYRDMLIERGVSKAHAYGRWIVLRVRRLLRLDGRGHGPEYPRRIAA